ncbi:MAG: Mut7-C RNAse domain-containing protein [Desulfurococcales archaeon]|nr:Mut7-C RNAse domain-containing protein [Desulfurococcales archaeon]
MGEGKEKFIADTMMGEVARWLRILGYDVLYNRNYSDPQILRIAKASKRTIITRDRGLHVKAIKNKIKSIYIYSDKIEFRLAELASKARIDLEINPDKSRCPECNGVLVKTTNKESVKDRVPPGALQAYDKFYICIKCGKVYWEGSHWRNIKRIINDVKSIIKSKNNKIA